MMQPTRESRLQTLHTSACPNGGGKSAILTLELIEGMTEEGEGRPPTYRELAESRDLSVGAIQDHIHILKKAKLLSHNAQPRSFKVLDGKTAGWREVARNSVPGETPGNRYPLNSKFQEMLDDLYTQIDMDDLDVEIIIRVKP